MSRALVYNFRLYVSGNTPNSAEAKINLNALCRLHLKGMYKIEVVDLDRDSNRALTDGIFMTPSLIKLAPSPVRMIVGTLNNLDSVLRALGVTDTRVEA